MARSKRLFVALSLSSLPLAMACNSLIGLDDFSKTECSGGSCGDGSVLPDVYTNGDTGITEAGDETTGTTPAVWAQWPMPNYDGGSLNLPNPLSYADASPPVSDEVTGLVWQTTTVGGGKTYTEAEAEQACAAITSDSTWRLPKRIELVSLLDFGQAKPPYISARFGVANLTLWTSSQKKPFDPSSPSYWVVDFKGGFVTTSTATASDVYAALCVKGK